MTVSDDEDETLAHFLESEVLSEVSDQEEAKIEEERQSKRLRVGDDEGEAKSIVQFQAPSPSKSRILESDNCGSSDRFSIRATPRRMETGFFSKIPSELFHHILKFLSSEDLVSCALVCRFLNFAASDESLWRRLYCMRWGLLPPTKKLRECAWKKLYIQRDGEDMVEFVRYCPSEFKEYYIQMQAAKRSQAPLPSQVNDDRIILDKTVADQVSIWKSSRGLTDKVVPNHDCSGDTCSYYQIGDVFVCEKTGQVHVCDDTCREAVLDPTNELLVCTISGHCFDLLLSPSEMEPDTSMNYNISITISKTVQAAKLLSFSLVHSHFIVTRFECIMCSITEQQQCGVSEEAEPFMGSGRFARAYLLGYSCADEKELQAALRSMELGQNIFISVSYANFMPNSSSALCLHPHNVLLSLATSTASPSFDTHPTLSTLLPHPP
ncbi:hypothetical protein TEA_007226 [Camellia sinensis var. sinensis]|uniref:F-box domain-containing protein n=1 Tax=Camellia sinensis var. sinensis TaxID=542762 RepID=A0A4S4E633_CAMSN|nr:hypothetical protein TEA_007226 [Camellia sinensis var. sinensis]